MKLSGKIVLITGASRGIGQAISSLFLAEEAQVINGDVGVPSEELVASDTPGLSEVRLDISDSQQVQRVANGVVQRFGKIDILINNAGICRDLSQKPEEVPIEEWRLITEINLFGTIYCINAVLPHMRGQMSGRIINMASLAGENGGTTASLAYTASKAAIIGVTKAIARMEGPNNITANCIAPGYIVTEMTRSHRHDLSRVPLGRRGEPVDVAHAALYLASDMGKYVTGTTLDVNGGVYMQ